MIKKYRSKETFMAEQFSIEDFKDNWIDYIFYDKKEKEYILLLDFERVLIYDKDWLEVNSLGEPLRKYPNGYFQKVFEEVE